MADLSAALQTARAAGYTDAQIADHLAADPGMGDQVKTARDHGYSDEDIVAHLAGATASPTATGTTVAAPVAAFTDTGEAGTPAQQAFYKGLPPDYAKAPAGSRENPVGLRAGDTPPQDQFYVDADGQLHAPSQDYAAEAARGFVAPIDKVGDDLSAWKAKQQARLNGPLPNPVEAIVQGVGDIGDTFKGLGDIAGIAAAPVEAITRPLAAAINAHVPLQAYGQDSPFSAPRPLSGKETVDQLTGDLATAVGGALPEAARLPVAAQEAAQTARIAAAPNPAVAVKQPLMSLDQLQTAKNAAYTAVDNAGVSFTPGAFKGLASDITSDMANANMNPLRHPKAASMVADIQAQADQGNGVTLTGLDQLRQVVRRDVANSMDGSEKALGNKIIGRIDNFVNNAGPGDVQSGIDPAATVDLLNNARALNTRYQKASTIADALESADLRAGSTNSGGNINNATRQKLRPLIDPTSSQQIGNLTPNETQAVRDVVVGTPGQNALRMLGKFSPANPLVAGLLGTMAVPTKGASAALGILGAGAKAAADRSTAQKISDLMDLISSGGVAAPKVAPSFSATPLVRGLIGGEAILRPLGQIPSVPSAQIARSR